MYSIWAVCARDLRVSFYSGRWFSAAFFFLIFMGAFFYYYTDGFVSAQQAQLAAGQPLPETARLIASVFGVLHFVMILLIPALTMGSFAEERSTGSLRFLLSAPLSPWGVVMGKFLAVMLAVLAILFVSLVFPFFLAAHGRVSPGLLFSAYSGLFLLSCSQLAFGLWISSLCRSQFSAFMFTMAGLFFLLIANLLAASVKGFSLTHLLVRYMGASGHYGEFLNGLVSLSDLVYFLAFSLFFLFLTALSFDSLRWR